MTDRIVTIPNLLSVIRLLLVPVFLWLVLRPEQDELALLVLMFAGITDYLDGKLARRLNQTSTVGAILDPVADRLFILAVVYGLWMRDIIPWWVAVILPPAPTSSCSASSRSCAPAATARCPSTSSARRPRPDCCTRSPLLLLGDGHGTVADLADVFGWAFAIWGVGLYWWGGVLYAFQVRRLMATTPRVARAIIVPQAPPRTGSSPWPGRGLLEQIADTALDDDYYIVRESEPRPSSALPASWSVSCHGLRPVRHHRRGADPQRPPATELERRTLAEDIEADRRRSTNGARRPRA